MAIDASVQHNDGFLPGIMLLTLSEDIAYPEQRENPGHKIFHGASYSAYTVL